MENRWPRGGVAHEMGRHICENGGKWNEWLDGQHAGVKRSPKQSGQRVRDVEPFRERSETQRLSIFAFRLSRERFPLSAGTHSQLEGNGPLLDPITKHAKGQT
jgi:hypothetical protein